MLRDELDVAVNDLMIALREAADAYHTAAKIASETKWTAFFEEARDHLEDMAAGVENEQRALGYLPKQPDQEKGLIHSAATHLKTTLSTEEVSTLLEERRLGEQRIMALSDHVINVAAASTNILRIARQAVEKSQKRLDQLEPKRSRSSGQHQAG